MERKKTIAIIPARLHSKRFPGKALAEIFSVPMIGHVYYRASMCHDLDKIIIVTPDSQIRQYAENVLKATVLEIKSEENNPLEISALALKKYQQQTGEKYEIAVVISGDEPMITHDMIANAISPFYIQKDLKASCLMCQITSDQDFFDRNQVKVIIDTNNYALYFSREPIPSRFKGKLGIPPLKKVNVMPFNAEFLIHLLELPPTTYEAIEEIPMLRVLEYGYKVKMIMNETITYAVDTKEDLEKIKKLMKNDYLLPRYISGIN